MILTWAETVASQAGNHHNPAFHSLANKQFYTAQSLTAQNGDQVHSGSFAAFNHQEKVPSAPLFILPLTEEHYISDSGWES